MIASIYVYLFLLLLIYFSFLFHKKYKVVQLIIFFLVSFLTSFRNLNIKDTPNYYNRFLHSSWDTFVFQGEPVLPFLMNISPNFIIFSLIHGFLLSSLYFIIFKKKNNSIFFGITIFPVIFIDSLVNGLRIGLAYPIIMLAIINNSILFLLLGFLTHQTSIISLPFVLRKSKKIWWFILIIVALLLIFNIDIIFQNRYYQRFFVYQETRSSSRFAGTTDSIALVFAFFIYIKLIKSSKLNKILFLSLALLFTFIFYLNFSNNYIYLRMLRLILIIIYSMIIRLPDVDLKRNRSLVNLSFIFGLLYTLNFMRQIIETYNLNNGFLPFF